MNYTAFYEALFGPLEAMLGPIDPETLFAIIGFDAGGPLNFSTIGNTPTAEFITYISCELSVRKEQKPASFGRYELLTSCNDQQWVRSKLTALAHTSMEMKFGHRHTIDIAACSESDEVIQGVICEREATARIDGKKYGVMRVIGVTRPELDFGVKRGIPQLLKKLKDAGVYPHTNVIRESVI